MESDGLRLVREVRGLRVEVGRVLDAMDPERSRLRPRDLQVPHAFGGARGLRLLLTIPGFAGLWQQRVPDDYVGRACAVVGGGELVHVACPCGAWPWLEEYAVTACPGDCGRWYLVLADAVCVRKFETADVAA